MYTAYIVFVWVLYPFPSLMNLPSFFIVQLRSQLFHDSGTGDDYSLCFQHVACIPIFLHHTGFVMISSHVCSPTHCGPLQSKGCLVLSVSNTQPY